MSLIYTIERWSHGWLICPPTGSPGIPVKALAEISPIAGKGAVINSAIEHHFRALGKAVTFCTGQPKELDTWEQEIELSLKSKPPLTRWWLGLHVGKSSAAIFSVLTPEDYEFKYAAGEYAQGSTPRDAPDFKRCLGLIELFPEWKPRLQEVANAFPHSTWPEIVKNWDEIAKTSPPEQRDTFVAFEASKRSQNT